MKYYTCDRCKEKTDGPGLGLIILPTKWGAFKFVLKEMEQGGINIRNRDLCQDCVLALLEEGIACLKEERREKENA